MGVKPANDAEDTAIDCFNASTVELDIGGINQGSIVHMVIPTFTCKHGVRDGLILKLVESQLYARKTLGCNVFEARAGEENFDEI